MNIIEYIMTQTQTDQQYKNHFFKILLLDGMANDIASFVQSKGIVDFCDQMDFDCGAIPDGDYDTLIDKYAPQQFLDLYTDVAHHRFAYAVDGLLKINNAYITTLMNYCKQKGSELNIPPLSKPAEAFQVVDSCFLDGRFGEETKRVINKSESVITWKRISDRHEKFWQNNCGGVNVYYQLYVSFLEGLLGRSKFTIQNNRNVEFSIS